MMDLNRVIVLDLASLGMGEGPDANRFNSVNADTIGHLDASYADRVVVPTLIDLGLGNIRWDNPLAHIPEVPASRGFYGKMCSQVNSARVNSGLREMFDFNASTRTLSIFDLLARQFNNVSIIASFANYLENQNINNSVQIPDDSKAFIELSNKLVSQHDGLIYCQPPELKNYAKAKDADGYVRQLNWLDGKIQSLCETLEREDLLIITANFANDPTYSAQQLTREYLPLLMYTPSIEHGHSLGIKRSSGVIASTILDVFGLYNQKVMDNPSLLHNLES